MEPDPVGQRCRLTSANGAKYLPRCCNIRSKGTLIRLLTSELSEGPTSTSSVGASRRRLAVRGIEAVTDGPRDGPGQHPDAPTVGPAGWARRDLERRVALGSHYESVDRARRRGADRRRVCQRREFLDTSRARHRAGTGTGTSAATASADNRAATEHPRAVTFTLGGGVLHLSITSERGGELVIMPYVNGTGDHGHYLRQDIQHFQAGTIAVTFVHVRSVDQIRRSSAPPRVPRTGARSSSGGPAPVQPGADDDVSSVLAS